MTQQRRRLNYRFIWHPEWAKNPLKRIQYRRFMDLRSHV
jgi:hypothetical protein